MSLPDAPPVHILRISGWATVAASARRVCSAVSPLRRRDRQPWNSCWAMDWLDLDRFAPEDIAVRGAAVA
jgi:hypothetical protein